MRMQDNEPFRERSSSSRVNRDEVSTGGGIGTSENQNLTFQYENNLWYLPGTLEFRSVSGQISMNACITSSNKDGGCSSF